MTRVIFPCPWRKENTFKKISINTILTRAARPHLCGHLSGHLSDPLVWPPCLTTLSTPLSDPPVWPTSAWWWCGCRGVCSSVSRGQGSSCHQQNKSVVAVAAYCSEGLLQPPPTAWRHLAVCYKLHDISSPPDSLSHTTMKVLAAVVVLLYAGRSCCTTVRWELVTVTHTHLQVVTGLSSHLSVPINELQTPRVQHWTPAC